MSYQSGGARKKYSGGMGNFRVVERDCVDCGRRTRCLAQYAHCARCTICGVAAAKAKRHFRGIEKGASA